MRLYRIRNYMGRYRLSMEEQASPVPGPREIVVRVGALSLNYRDLLLLADEFRGIDPEGLVPMSDAAGVVTAVGDRVSRFQVGTRVMGCFFPAWLEGPATAEALHDSLGGTVPGVMAEEILLCEEAAVATPEHLSDVEASTLPCAALTAWNGLVSRGGLRAGQSALFQGTGGVSTFGLLFAVACGARPYVTSRSDEKLARARALGALGTLNYLVQPDWAEEILQRTGGEGVDHILEVGGARTLPSSIEAIAYGGHIALIGVLGGRSTPQEAINPFPLARKNATLSGVHVGSRADFEAMAGFISDRRLHPVIDRVFPFAEAEEAYAYLKSAAHFGKVVIEV